MGEDLDLGGEIILSEELVNESGNAASTIIKGGEWTYKHPYEFYVADARTGLKYKVSLSESTLSGPGETIHIDVQSDTDLHPQLAAGLVLSLNTGSNTWLAVHNRLKKVDDEMLGRIKEYLVAAARTESAGEGAGASTPPPIKEITKPKPELPPAQ